MKLSEAKVRHSTVRHILAGWKWNKDVVAALEGAWAAATATPDNGSAMASAVRTGIPLDYIPLFCSWDSIPAAYFLDCLSVEMQKTVVVQNLGDTFYCAQLAQRAFAQFEVRRQQADTIEEGFGCDRSSAWGTLRKCDDQSSSMTTRMVEIAKLAGRMFKALRYDGLPKPSADPQMVTGVDSGDDVPRLLDEEIALLNVPGANAETLSRLSEKQTAQFEMTGEQPHGRGPLVLALDESGSMHEHRLVWSKACAVALARVALAEGRKVRVAHYSTSTRIQDLDVNDHDSMRELAWSHLGGGTCIEAAMHMAVAQCIELERDGILGADIVFITDGQDKYGSQPFEQAKSHGIQLWTVSIDCKLTPTDHLVSYATKYIHVDDRVLSANEGTEMVSEMKAAALDNGSLERVEE